MRSGHTKDVADLIDLARIFHRAGPVEGRTIARSVLEGSDGLKPKLYQAVRDNPELSERELAARVFGDVVPDAQKFSRLKSRLKALLLDAIPFLDLEQGNYSGYMSAVYGVARASFVCQILLLLSARDLAASIARKTLPVAIKMEEWSSAMQLLLILRADAMHKRKTKRYQFYADEYLHCERLLAAENMSKVQTEEIQMVFTNHAGPQPKHVERTVEAAARAIVLVETHPSFKLSFSALRLRSIAAQLQEDYDETIKISDEAATLFRRYPQFYTKARQGEFAIHKLVAAIHIRLHSIADEAILECRQCIDHSKNNWFVYREYEFLHLMHTLCFAPAMAVVEEVLVHPRYPGLSKMASERWELFRLYAEYTTGRRVPIRNPGDFSRLLPTFTADKTGHNTGLIVLHVLLLAERGQFADLVDRVDFIRGYRKRFLRGAQHSHASLFFKMTALIELADLDVKRLDKKARSLYLELLRTEREEPIQGEVILPYSWIWNRLRSLLREYHPLLS
jgi:hypothetical protein